MRGMVAFGLIERWKVFDPNSKHDNGFLYDLKWEQKTLYQSWFVSRAVLPKEVVLYVLNKQRIPQWEVRRNTNSRGCGYTVPWDIIVSSMILCTQLILYSRGYCYTAWAILNLKPSGQHKYTQPPAPRGEDKQHERVGSLLHFKKPTSHQHFSFAN